MLIEKRKAVNAPEFQAADSHGRSIHLSDYNNEKNVMLVFNRGFT